MKITKISITFEPNEQEKAHGSDTRVLERTADKRWSSVNDPNGMLPFEVRMAHEFQEIIKEFNVQSE